MKRYLALPGTVIVSMAAIAAPAGAAVVASADGALGKPHGHHALRGAHSFSFYGTVLSATRGGLVVHTSSGQTVRFSARQLRRSRRSLAGLRHDRRRHLLGARRQLAHAALHARPPHGPLVTNVLRLQPGVIVVITESVGGRGGVSVKVALPPANITVQENASGLVTAVRQNAFAITTAGGTRLHLHMAPRKLASLALQRSDSVSVTYHQRAAALVADDVLVTGP